MKRCLSIASATVLGMTSPVAYAQNSVTLYGLIDTGLTYANHVATETGHGSLVRYADGVTGNRWGIRGTEDLGNGLKAIFTLENGFSLGSGSILQGGALFGRQAWIGLQQREWGALTLGRQYSISRDYIHSYTTAFQSPAVNYAYHINDLDQLVTSRIDNAVKFASADFGGFTFGALYGFSNQAGAFAGSSPPAAGTDSSASGSSRTYSAGIHYASHVFSVGMAYTNIRFPGSAMPAFSSNIANISMGPQRTLATFGVGSSYVIGKGMVWGNWTHTQLVPIVGGQSIFNNYEVGGKYSLTRTVSSGIGYTFSELSGQFHGRWHQINSFFDYTLSKRTDVYLLAIFQKAAGSNLIDGQDVPVQAQIGSSPTFIGNSGTGANTQLVLRVGLRHRF
ncbi:porin [Paraburkholderia sp. GAS199]|uniref:porin n=1 Tax=Paraburkholderia sp. GAS199 TaxID=3035126 RepID=UPI003D236765